MSESILKTLKDEHRHVRELILKVKEASDVGVKKELYLKLKEELILHMEGEERTLYSHLIDDVNDEEAEEVALQAEDEHQEMKVLLSKLDNIGIENDEWDINFFHLSNLIEIHVQEEEDALFAEAKQDFSKEELIDFGDEYQDVKLHTELY